MAEPTGDVAGIVDGQGVKATTGRDHRKRKSANAFRTISEVSEALNVPQHVLRFWETKFSQIKPMKRGGGRRYYRPEDIVLLRGVRELLYEDGYTIKGVQKLLREGGVKVLQDRAQGTAPEAVADPHPEDHPDTAAAVAAPPAGDQEVRQILLDVLSELEGLKSLISSRS